MRIGKFPLCCYIVGAIAPRSDAEPAYQPMSLRFWKQISAAFRRLNPESVILESQRPFSVALVGSGAEAGGMEDWLAPAELSPAKQEQARKRLFRISLPIHPRDHALLLSATTVRFAGNTAAEDLRALSRDYFYFHSKQPEVTASEALEGHPELALALARHFPPFRDPVVAGLIKTVSLENSAFAILSALPNVIPNPLELPWAFGEFASDTAILTANQVRLALLIAAASDSAVGFAEQKGQVASILGSALGWRALARELAGKVPAGGGLVVKGLIAYAGTYTVGLGLARFHRLGSHLTRAEKKQAYRDALHSGRAAVEKLARRALTGRGERT